MAVKMQDNINTKGVRRKWDKAAPVMLVFWLEEEEGEMSSSGQALLTVLVLVAAGWFSVFCLPPYLRTLRIERKYGRRAEKLAAIERLLRNGTISQLRYGGGISGRDEFSLVIGGPFGTFTRIRKWTGDRLHTDDDSTVLPPEVAEAFDGYIDTIPDVVRLFRDSAFLEKLLNTRKPHFCIKGDAYELLTLIIDVR